MKNHPIRRAFLGLLSALVISSTGVAAESFEALEGLETPVVNWKAEYTPVAPPQTAPVKGDLSGHYEEFKRDGVVTIYLGWGKDAYHANRAAELLRMIQALADQNGVTLRYITRDAIKDQLLFEDSASAVRYRIQLGHERDAYMQAFSENEIVMYHGHSRYGRGPAFGSYTNYFRMGNKFRTIEVEVQNPYFLTEPYRRSSVYPLLDVTLDGREYKYQIRGQLLDSAYLPDDSYTKIINGLDRDLKNTQFLPGKQIIWLYSCSNEHYFKSPLRELYPNPKDKFIFGTKDLGYWSSKPAAVFILSVVQGIRESSAIVDRMNATHDCNDCFTTY